MKNFSLESEHKSSVSHLIENNSNSILENSLKTETYSIYNQSEDLENEFNTSCFEMSLNSKPENVDNCQINYNKENIIREKSESAELWISKIKNKPLKKKINKTIKKDFSCIYDKCTKKYKSKENLSLHIKNIHLNIKPYMCRFCSAAFSHRNGNKIFLR